VEVESSRLSRERRLIEGEHVLNPVVTAPGLVNADLIRFGVGNIVRDD
jgi:hypothetical protein